MYGLWSWNSYSPCWCLSPCTMFADHIAPAYRVYHYTPHRSTCVAQCRPMQYRHTTRSSHGSATSVAAVPPANASVWLGVLALRAIDDGGASLLCRHRGIDREDEDNYTNFTFSRVFGPEAGQVEFYRAVAAPMVQGLMESGLSSVLMAYGVSGAGKTYTMEVITAFPVIVGFIRF